MPAPINKADTMYRILAVVALLPTLAFSQIAVNINSGNPAAPFPQFQPYVNPTDTLYNLATKNPIGVSHAEMEKSIREAYQIMMNGASKPGGSVGGLIISNTSQIHSVLKVTDMVCLALLLWRTK